MASDGRGFDDLDPIQPTLIEHKVDEIIIEGEIEQSYNFVDYWFDCAVGRMRARAYLDRAHEASIYPPMLMVHGKPPQFLEDWMTREAVIRYLSRRFLVIKELGPQGYEHIWMATHARRVYEHLGLRLED